MQPVEFQFDKRGNLSTSGAFLSVETLRLYIYKKKLDVRGGFLLFI